MDDNLIDLGTGFDLELGHLSNNEAEITIEQFIAALEATTTLTVLTVSFDHRDLGAYDATPENNRRVIEPLCHCISNLRLHNAQHPLRRLRLTETLSSPELGIYDDEMDAIEKFMVAAKQFGIIHLELSIVYYLPVKFLVEFCRDNNSLKVLELLNVSFSFGLADFPWLMNNGPPNNPFILTLDKLRLDCLEFTNTIAAAEFANLFAHVNVSSLELGSFPAPKNDDEEEDEEDTQERERILSELQMPSAEQLTLNVDCRMEHFKAALNAGMATVTDLHVFIFCDKGDKTARLELLAIFIRRAVKLSTLRFKFLHFSGPHISLPPLLFQAMESCATATQIQVTKYNHQYVVVRDVCPEVQLLQKSASRNRQLDQFATNHGTYPTEELPELMRQFENCPTGRYMLACLLPEVLSFAELYAVQLSRRRTNSPTSKKSKLQ